MTSYLNTAEFCAFALHCLGSFSLPVYVFGTYCILFKTPATMRPVQWTLFNFHLWSCLLDVGISFLTTPYVLFPLLAGYPLGLLKDFGVGMAEQTFIVVVMVGITFASILAIFESRLRVFIFTDNCWHSVRNPWLVVNYLMGALFFLPNYLSVPEQKMAGELISTWAGCISNNNHMESMFILSTGTRLLLRTGAATLVPIAFEIIFIALLTGRIISQHGGKMISAYTARLQKKFQNALVMQVRDQ
uniref:Uncharacterized protein n=1 Tax=Caenorhabditis japonica TaxID=281687 RepID=A0A8R1DRE5_CAEJA